MKLLLAGFDAFGGIPFNPAAELVKRLARNPPIDSFEELKGVVLPTKYEGSTRMLLNEIEAVRPEAVVILGLAEGSAEIRLERFALNIADCPAPDNEGEIRVGRAIIIGAPAAYETNLPLVKLLGLCSREKLLTISNHAGAFVCNYIYYQALHYAHSHGNEQRVLFVHLPLSASISDREVFAAGSLSYLMNFIRQLLKNLRDVLDDSRWVA